MLHVADFVMLLEETVAAVCGISGILPESWLFHHRGDYVLLAAGWRRRLMFKTMILVRLCPILVLTKLMELTRVHRYQSHDHSAVQRKKESSFLSCCLAIHILFSLVKGVPEGHLVPKWFHAVITPHFCLCYVLTTKLSAQVS
jgi:hypothetical protein